MQIDFYGNRTLKQVDGNNQPAGVLQYQDNPFGSSQWSILDAHSFSNTHRGIRLTLRAGFDYGANREEFLFFDWLWSLSDSDNGVNSWNHKNRQPLTRIESAENVTGKQRKF